ncbi:MAG TPA: hypothetical protein VN364_09750 [Bellilinea sp.]|nr:hypothetical protein [Bellilinea sp.]
MTYPVDPKPKVPRRWYLILVLVGLFVAAWVLWPEKIPGTAFATQTPTAPTLHQTATNLPIPTSTITPSPTTAAILEAEVMTKPYPHGLMVLSLSDGYYRHLFAYHPQDLPLTRLTDHPWDDIDPAISPDGTRMAYASRRNGYFDIYIFDFSNGQSTRVTDSAAYDGKPTWSPDSQWLAYESYQSGNLDIFIQSLADLTQPAMQLTTDPSPDFAPDWSPAGSLLAFTSLRSGEPEIWIAALDQTEYRFQNRSRNPSAADVQPAWSPDGQNLAWTTIQDGFEQVVITPAKDLATSPELLGAGADPLWDPAGVQIFVRLIAKDSLSLTGYNPQDGRITLPAVPLPSALHGVDLHSGAITELLPKYLLADSGPPTSPLAALAVSQPTDAATGRIGLVALSGITAPYAYLSDSADESFYALRQEIARVSGWDVLGNLQNAFLPVTEPSLPGSTQDWLETGLGIAINPLPYQAGWMTIQREDSAGQTRWRLYIYARYQDGSMGQPLALPIWDLEARANGDPDDYEQGGTPGSVPAGYWVDFTELAARFGWQRLPANSNWRTFFGGARFNQFAFSGGGDWEAGMQSLYPPELVHLPTQIPTMTSLPTKTPLPLNMLTATAQPTPWLPPVNLEPRPTWTPLPGEQFP